MQFLKEPPRGGFPVSQSLFAPPNFSRSARYQFFNFIRYDFIPFRRPRPAASGDRGR